MEQIRPFCEEDRETVLEMLNKLSQPHRRQSLDLWRGWDNMRPKDEVSMRLVVSTPAIGYVNAIDRNTSAWRHPGLCAFQLVVDEEHRRQGIGSKLYQNVLDFAHERNLKKLRTIVIEATGEEPAVAFLKKRGFVELERIKPSHLNVTNFDATPFNGAIERVEQSGIRLFSYADLEDTEENRHKLYDLCTQIDRDMPHRDSQEAESPSYDFWIKEVDLPYWCWDGIILAESDGKWVGVTQLFFDPDTNIGGTSITGVLKEYRGRGLATALKLRVIEAAKARNCPIITTENQEDNAPMLAINRKLGFQPDRHLVSYVKALV